MGQNTDNGTAIGIRVIGKRDIKDGFISTVFSGVDLRPAGAGPSLFETVVFQNDRVIADIRCNTLEEAERKHDDCVKRYAK